jgi:hypothetical protein
MALEIALAIAIQIEPPGGRAFSDRGENEFTIPFDFARDTDIHG